MKMIELVNLTSYEVKASNYGGPHEHILIDKKMAVPVLEQRGKIRRVAMARGRLAYRQMMVSSIYGGMRPTTDHDSPQVMTWEPVWMPINKIIRPWDEYVEEKEIEDEMRAQARERIEKQRAEQEAELSGRIERLSSWLDNHFPGHEIDIRNSRYGGGARVHTGDTLDWWERLIETYKP